MLSLPVRATRGAWGNGQIAALNSGNQAPRPWSCLLGSVTRRQLRNEFAHALSNCVSNASWVPGAVSGSGDDSRTDTVSLLQGVNILEEKYTLTVSSCIFVGFRIPSPVPHAGQQDLI